MRSFIVSTLAFMLLFTSAFGVDCVFKGHAFKIGQTYTPPGRCVGWTCESLNRLHALSCAPRYSAKRNVICKKLPDNLTLPYPQCCGGYKC